MLNNDYIINVNCNFKLLRAMLDTVCQAYSEEIFNKMYKEQFIKNIDDDYYNFDEYDYFAYVYAIGTVSSLTDIITIKSYETYYDDNNEFVTNLLYSWDNIAVWKAIFILYYSTDLPDFDYEPSDEELDEFFNDVLPYLELI